MTTRNRPRTERLAFPEHADLGNELRYLRVRMQRVHTVLKNRYGFSDIANPMSRALFGLDASRKALDKLLHDEHPDRASNSVYFDAIANPRSARLRKEDAE